MIGGEVVFVSWKVVWPICFGQNPHLESLSPYYFTPFAAFGHTQPLCAAPQKVDKHTCTIMFCGKGRTSRNMWLWVSRLQFVRVAPTDGQERTVYDWNVKSKVRRCKVVLRTFSGQRQNRFDKTSSEGVLQAPCELKNESPYARNRNQNVIRKGAKGAKIAHDHCWGLLLFANFHRCGPCGLCLALARLIPGPYFDPTPSPYRATAWLLPG